jgi:hypothetical protein
MVTLCQISVSSANTGLGNCVWSNVDLYTLPQMFNKNKYSTFVRIYSKNFIRGKIHNSISVMAFFNHKNHNDINWFFFHFINSIGNYFLVRMKVMRTFVYLIYFNAIIVFEAFWKDVILMVLISQTSYRISIEVFTENYFSYLFMPHSLFSRQKIHWRLKLPKLYQLQIMDHRN